MSSKVSQRKQKLARSPKTKSLSMARSTWLELGCEICNRKCLETAFPISQSIDKDSYWSSHREKVKNSFVVSWDAYAKYTWGQDRFHPISKTGSQMSPSGLGWIVVDSLDTLMIMNLTTRLSEARKWCSRDLTYNQDQDVSTFEMTIRMLGGLLSAHYLSTVLPDVSSRRDYIFLIPYASINIGTRHGLPSHADGGASSTAEAITLQLAMKYLAHLTGNEVYCLKAKHFMKVIDGHRMQAGLLLIFVHPDTGHFRYKEIRLGSRGDPYYGKLPEQHLCLEWKADEPVYREMWEEALAGIQKHLVTSAKHSKLQFIAELLQGIGGPLPPKMDHLAMYTVTESGLSPEITWFDVDEADLRHHLPFLMYRMTNDPMYRKWGWEIFKAFKKHTVAKDREGYTSLHDVIKVPTPQRDNIESFWLAETLKYLYLLFSPRDFLQLAEVVFNTEAHVLPRFNQTRFQTGWSRRDI
ncbi:glycoside hydrolase [Aspergillus bertholletiae]|uniref:alpha-1,2-Mannosidase n=1 Tax=Aspergillus bertholletiae TaxID=1226010 RepID=A0A5N7BI27_9EURO|nr:glycoside hydrolase [Aspergillus bertholletiae]